MSLTYGFGLVIIILFFHNVVLVQNEADGSIEKKEGNDIDVEKKKRFGQDHSSAFKTEEMYTELYDDVAKEENIEKENNTSAELSSSSSEHTKQSIIPTTVQWKSGIVPYRIKRRDYDSIISARIRAAMLVIERSSCVVFKDMNRNKNRLKKKGSPWLSIENPRGARECSHTTLREEKALDAAKDILVIGYDCIQQRDILHALLHALGFKDEVTHPQRDLYIRIIWPNIQPKSVGVCMPGLRYCDHGTLGQLILKELSGFLYNECVRSHLMFIPPKNKIEEYRPLFYMKKGETQKELVEYDSLSVMHFHDRAFTINGRATIVPQIPGLLIAPSDTLSQLDVMKLRLEFGHECNKRKVANLLQTCEKTIRDYTIE